MLVDTHAHLFWQSFEKDRKNVLREAQKQEVEKIIVPGVDVETSRKAIELARQYKNLIYAAIGIHPEGTLTQRSLEIDGIEQLVKENRDVIVAIGEIGLDCIQKVCKILWI